MLQNRRGFLKLAMYLGGYAGITATLPNLDFMRAEAGLNIPCKEKALKVYNAITKWKGKNKDLIEPKVLVNDSKNEYSVLLERVLDNGESRYTVTAVMICTGRDKKTVSEGVGIHRRTHGPNYKDSLVLVDDDNLDGIVDKGMTVRTKSVIKLQDTEWNQICKEKIFNPQAEKITYGTLFARVYDKALDDIMVHLGI